MKLLLSLYLLSNLVSARISIGTNSLNNIEGESFSYIVSSKQDGTEVRQLFIGEAGKDVYQEALPYDVFVPVAGSGTSSLVPGNTLFATYLPDPYNDTDDAIGFQIYHEEGLDRYVYVAYEPNGGGDYVIVPTSFSPIIVNVPSIDGNKVIQPTGEANRRIVYFDLNTIFREDGINPNNSTSTTNFARTKDIMVFIDTENRNIGSTIDPGLIVDENAMFFRILITDQVPSIGVAVSRVDPLDAQVEVEIADNNPGNVGDYLYKIGVHIQPTLAISAGAFSTLPGTASTRLEPGIEQGDFIIDGLTNNITYHITASYITNYQIVGPYFDSLAATPDEILTFLREKSCFIVSAGFGEDHFVIDYFRMIRDQILVKTSLGQKFVDFYYKYSPALAVKIYYQPILRTVVKAISYIVYFFLKYFYLVFIALAGLLYLGRKRYLKMV